MENNIRESRQRNKCRKIIGLKHQKLKLKKKREKKRKTPQNCKSPMYRQRFITAIKTVTEKKKKKKKLKSSIRFHSANKINNYNGTGGKEKKKEKSKRIYRTSQNIRIIDVFPESLLSESFPSLGVTVHLPSPGCPPTLC